MNRRPPLRLAASVIARNEAGELRACLESVRAVADEIIVVDCSSSDGTSAVARRAGARVFRRPNMANLNVNKAYGVSKARAEWIIYLDPDERLTPALAREIGRVIRSGPAEAAFDVRRRNFYFGRWLRFGGKYPDRQRRLFRRGRARFPARHVHEKIAVRGSVGRLAAPMDHHPYPDFAAFFRKLVFYADFQARFLARRGVRPGPLTTFRYLFWLPFTRFVRRYVFRGGFLDGVPGLLACVHDALTHILALAFLKGLGRRRS